MRINIKTILGYILSVAIMLPSIPAFAAAPFSGDGTEENPYMIESTADLVKLGELTNMPNSEYADKHYILTADLDMEGVAFGGICELENADMSTNTSILKFTGTFDGDEHIISNLTVDRSDNATGVNTFAGFICWAGEGATVKNLGIVDAKIKSGATGKSGGFIGRATGNITLENCFIKNVALTSENGGAALVATLSSTGSVAKNCYSINVSGGGKTGVNGGRLAGEKFVEMINVYSTAGIGAGHAVTATNVVRIQSNSTAEVKEGFIEASNGAFETDVFNKNNGYPVLLWENEGEEDEPEPEPEPEPEVTTNDVFENGQGNGSIENPYQLSTPEDLVKLAELTNTIDTTYASRNYVIVNDIDMSGVEFDGICEKEVSTTENNWNYAGFTGTLDGAEHVIRNLTVDRTDNETGVNTYAALIVWAAENAVIKNLGLIDMTVRGGTVSGRVGGFVGRSTGAINIENCFVRGINTNAKNDSGAIAGDLKGGTIKNCYSTDITSYVGTGGIFGTSSNSPYIENVWSTNYIPSTNAVNFLKISGTVTAQEIETFISNSNGAFKEDIFSKNNGYPVLAWENEMISEDGTIIITDYSFDNTSGVNSSFTIKNCNTESKSLAVGIIVYGENNKMLGAMLYEDFQLASGEQIKESFSFADIEDAVSVKLYLWNTLSEQKLYQIGGVEFKTDK